MAGTFAPGAGMRAIYVSTKNLYFHKTMGFERQNDRDRTKRSRPPLVSYELLIIITICYFMASLFPFLFLRFFPLRLMQWPFSRSRDYVLQAASTFNYTTSDN